MSLSTFNNDVKQLQDFQCKIVLVGDRTCGKTALIHQFVNEEFLQAYSPTIFERYSITYKVLNYNVHCTIWDTSGCAVYDTVRPLAYPETHVFILCFALSDPSTLDNVINKWHPEIRRHCQTTPLVLCGCQNDLKNDSKIISELALQQKSPVSSEQGVTVSRQIGAITYVETSSKACPKTVQDALQVSIMAALGKLNINNALFQQENSSRNGIYNKDKTNIKFKNKSKALCTIM